jgi:putative SOS response-associated peptidase YedK
MQPDINEPELQEIMKVKQPRIDTFQVSSRVNSSRNEGPELLLPSSGKQALLF